MQNILNSFSGKKAIVFFKGFAPERNKIIISRSDSLLDVNIALDGKYLNIPSIISSTAKQMMIQKILSANYNVLVGVYEQYTAISQSIHDWYDGEIAIVDNNLFKQSYPSAIHPETAKILYNYFQQEKPMDELESYLSVYSNVEMIGGNYFLTPIDRYTDEKDILIPLLELDSQKPLVPRALENSCCISASSADFPSYISEILNGQKYIPVTYVADIENHKVCLQLACWKQLLDSLGLPCGIRFHTRFEQINHAEDDKYLPILQKYWGANARFRILNFYRDPHISNDIISVSQGHIISAVIAQSEKTLTGNQDFNNIFITAPTGAGKSLLFQIPAIHLAKKYGAVTIVVTPLIALMKDQVINLEDHQIYCATYLNSDITYEERQYRIEAIRNGKKSIVYIAAEMLVTNSIENLIGDRSIGLFVVDEAHIVTSWGKDFRADYWYLGDFLNNLRREPVKGSNGPHKKALLFPVLCLTATAVLGGSEDVVNETIESLSLDNPIMFLGSVRRDNITFDIFHIDPKEAMGGIEEFKTKKAAERIRYFVENKQKTLIYCPYIKQAESIFAELETDPKIRNQVATYYGKMNPAAKRISQDRFRNGNCTVMICTKAFGMGVDIKDIQNVYHYAPSGNLADYVQEIGRAAREPAIHGHAVVDFLNSDLRYTRILYGLSGLKQYQLREMLRKLYDLYSVHHHRNLLVSPDTFSYLFEAKDVENKVKCGLLLIGKDLYEKYSIPILIVRPKAMMTKNYVNVPPSIEKQFIQKYGIYATDLHDDTHRVIAAPKNSHIQPTIVTNSGNIYEIDMARLWEDNFSELTFGQFKYQFFNGTLINFSENERLSARIRVTVRYSENYSAVTKKIYTYLTELAEIFRKYKQGRTEFSAEDFKKDLEHQLELKSFQQDFSNLVLNLFVKDVSQNIVHNNVGDKYRFIAANKSHSNDNMSYRVLNYNYITMADSFLELLAQCAPCGSETFESFFPVFSEEGQGKLISVLSLLELFDLASYEISGGERLEVFVRLNDPLRIRQLSNGNYSNALLTDLSRRHDSAQKVMARFFENDFTNDERWNIIENYFLGREDVVNQLLSIQKLKKIDSPQKQNAKVL